jgi:hypothetical protein
MNDALSFNSDLTLLLHLFVVRYLQIWQSHWNQTRPKETETEKETEIETETETEKETEGK